MFLSNFFFFFFFFLFRVIDKYFDTVGGLNTASQQEMNSLKGKLLSQRKTILLKQWALFVEKNPNCSVGERNKVADGNENENGNKNENKNENQRIDQQSHEGDVRSICGKNVVVNKEDNYQSKVKGQYQGQYRDQYRDQNKGASERNFHHYNGYVEMTDEISNSKGGLAQEHKVLQPTQRTDYQASSNFPSTQSESQFQSRYLQSHLQDQCNPYSCPTAAVLSSSQSASILNPYSQSQLQSQHPSHTQSLSTLQPPSSPYSQMIPQSTSVALPNMKSQARTQALSYPYTRSKVHDFHGQQTTNSQSMSAGQYQQQTTINVRTERDSTHQNMKQIWTSENINPSLPISLSLSLSPFLSPPAWLLRHIEDPSMALKGINTHPIMQLVSQHRLCAITKNLCSKFLLEQS